MHTKSETFPVTRLLTRHILNRIQSKGREEIRRIQCVCKGTFVVSSHDRTQLMFVQQSCCNIQTAPYDSMDVRNGGNCY